MKTLLLATRNPGKVREITEILSDLGVQINSLLDYPFVPEILEDGKTFADNAFKKARIAFERTNLPSLADDSGLEVFSLNGEPGIFSSQYAGKKATYGENNKKLLAALKGTSPDQRRAQFRCAIAFVAPGIVRKSESPNGLLRRTPSEDSPKESLGTFGEKIVEGICPGTIAEQPRGGDGFGYDPIFIPDGFQQTYAELPLKVKNKISHRGLALEAIKDFLADYFQSRKAGS